MIGRKIILKFVRAYVDIRLFSSEAVKIRMKLRLNTKRSTLGCGPAIKSFSVSFSGSYLTK